MPPHGRWAARRATHVRNCDSDDLSQLRRTVADAHMRRNSGNGNRSRVVGAERPAPGVHRNGTHEPGLP
ncbi:hypothetical protein GCM10009862_02280 [Microbacterium binotii]|uniref:Uncharacterized protein n=1 Tax=Microbacterium binotii TaxID=462710 RepID=A0ABN3P5Z0_9MICO